jgi:hypothetical protein
MSNLLFVAVGLLFISCSSIQSNEELVHNSPGYQQTRQMDESSLESSFIGR